MSVESITWALKVPVPASSAKFVLVVLANQANDESGRSFPSIKYLSDATGQDRKTVISNLAKLAEWGLIEDTGERVGQTKQVIVYRLLKDADLFTEQSQKRNSSKNGTVPKTDGNSTVFPCEQSQKRDTEPSFNHQEPKSKRTTPSAAPTTLPDPPDWIDRDAWAGFVAMRKRIRAPLTHRAAELIFRELEKFAPHNNPNEVLDQSTRNGWRGVFALKSNEGSHHAGHRESAAERVRRNAIEGERRDRAAAGDHGR